MSDLNQVNETHNGNVVKNPYKIEGCTPDEVKHNNSISKDIDKPKKNTKL